MIKEINCLSKRTNDTFLNVILKEVIIPSAPNYLKNFLKKILSHLKENNINIENILILNKKFIKRLGGEDYLNDISEGFINESIETARKTSLFHD